MAVPAEIMEFTDDQGLAFLELLAHNLTIGVRMAAGRRQPMGPLTEGQTRLAMYWINEALHNVVQLTRELRLESERWSQNETWKWIELWQKYNHGAREIEWAIHYVAQENRPVHTQVNGSSQDLPFISKQGSRFSGAPWKKEAPSCLCA